MLVALQHCATLDWSRISPAVFGSLFQSVMLSTDGKKKRRQIGAHYTSERDILRVIGPLFLDEIKSELERAGTSKRMLNALHERIAEIRIFDPACGCGNFLVVAYRELRLLEYEILRRLYGERVEPEHLKVRIEQVNGIEINEWPARIAEVAMFLIEHQMDDRMRALLPKFFTRLPIKSVANIHVGNALRMDWNEVIPASKCTYILGNPPFVGSKWQTESQREDMATCAVGVKNYGLLDYVCGWYLKAVDYTKESKSRCAFVSTNSISQGEQVGVLWNELFARGAKIHFAHRTFEWQSEARGEAHVHVVIVGFGLGDVATKRVFEYESARAEPAVREARNISPYLVEGADFALTSRSKPLCDVPEMVSGNQPIDDGNYLFTSAEYAEFVSNEPRAAQFFKRWLGGEEFINGVERWYLYLSNCEPSQIRAMPYACARVEAVRKFRLGSRRASTVKLAATPTRFQVEFSPTQPFLALPQVSSERRVYIPMAYLTTDYLPGDKLRCVASATLYHFGVLTSLMQMSWTRLVTGRLKSDYMYSAKLVYNNFPWPQAVDSKSEAAIESAARTVLDARAAHPEATLADLYDPIVMPADLRDAHDNLDRAVDRCYRKQPFTSERERVEFLFDLYQKLAAPLAAEAKPKKRTRKSKSPDSSTVTE
jgi:hypothetical protein